MVLIILPVILLTGSASLTEIVEAQEFISMLLFYYQEQAYFI